MTNALLVYYSRISRDSLERILRSQGFEVNLISGRAHDATQTVRRQSAEVVVIDKDAPDISVAQAVRQIAQILPRSLIFTAAANQEGAEVYRQSRRVGTVSLGKILEFTDGALPERTIKRLYVAKKNKRRKL